MDSLTLGSLIHWFSESLIHRFIGSLAACIESLLRCFIDSLVHWQTDSLTHWLIDWLVHWFIYSVAHGFFMSFRWDLNNHLLIRWCTSQLWNFIASTSQKKNPVESMGRWFPIAMFLVRTARAVPGITGIKSLEVMSHTDLPISNFQSRRNQSKYQMCIVVWYCRDFPGTLACGTRVAYDSFLIFWHQVCYSGHVNQHTDTKTYLTSHW